MPPGFADNMDTTFNYRRKRPSSIAHSKIIIYLGLLLGRYEEIITKHRPPESVAKLESQIRKEI
jgi:hypothetical protein